VPAIFIFFIVILVILVVSGGCAAYIAYSVDQQQKRKLDTVDHWQKELIEAHKKVLEAEEHIQRINAGQRTAAEPIRTSPVRS
jgi:hypothetical protein